MSTPKPLAELDKSELRRHQVLEAATECFRREGFHGSSIARISQAAGMSPGHIYHYFANKEAIVEAIAEREEHDMAELLREMEQDRAGGTLAERLTRNTERMIQHNRDPNRASLFLELSAEAARNPSVRAILQRSDRAISAQFTALVDRIGAPDWLERDELDRRMEMIAALVHGLTVRSLLEPRADAATTARLFNQIVHSLLDAPR